MSMEFEEHEEQEEEIGMPVQASYDSIANSIRTKMGISTGSGEGGGGASAAARKAAIPIRYRECLKNHAVNIGGHALDGCGEFMAAGDEGTLDALKCAACNCHRNFHRKETEGGEGGGVGGGGGGLYHPQQQQQHHQQISAAYYRPPAGYLHLTPSHPRPLALPSVSGGGGYSRDEDDVSNPSSSGGGGGSGGSKKRFRTKFTGEQKEKMLGFAETLGWRIQKHDEASVEQFCAESGVKRQVLKVWMHNNKNTLGKKP